jgi:hypothetical protein
VSPRVTITVVRGVRDPLTGDWSADPAEHTVPDCRIAPTGSTEPTVGTGDQVSSRCQVYVRDPDVDVLATDRIRLPGEAGQPRWQVVGDPARWGPGAVITIDRVTG